MATGYSKSSPRPRKVVNCVNDEVKAYDAVPNMDPVNDPEKTLAVTALVTNSELSAASDPDTTNFFQLGILFYVGFFCGWLRTLMPCSAPTSPTGPTGPI